jgi:hypothetical protein
VQRFSQWSAPLYVTGALIPARRALLDLGGSDEARLRLERVPSENSAEVTSTDRLRIPLSSVFRAALVRFSSASLGGLLNTGRPIRTYSSLT